ncbi:MAG: NifB/NifX family molybdenum-iron cluster-binding protein [Butyricicoccaceae bacterium]
MKIAVTYENGNVFQHFGHTEQFKVYTVENGAITVSEIVSSDGAGHGALAQLLGAHEIDALICGGIGGGARVALGNAGIQVFGGVSGSADAAAEAFARGELAWNPNASCSGHGHDHHHGEGHSCGSHGCGGGCH